MRISVAEPKAPSRLAQIEPLTRDEYDLLRGIVASSRDLVERVTGVDTTGAEPWRGLWAKVWHAQAAAAENPPS
jgi:hypothetical protein